MFTEYKYSNVISAFVLVLIILYDPAIRFIILFLYLMIALLS